MLNDIRSGISLLTRGMNTAFGQLRKVTTDLNDLTYEQAINFADPLNTNFDNSNVIDFSRSQARWNGAYGLPSQVPGWAFSRADANCTATALTADGTVVRFASGVPRITNRGILIEETRTNFVTVSSGLAGAGYSVILGTIDASDVSGLAPDGSATVRRLNVTVTATIRTGSTAGGTAGTTYAGSVFVRTRDGATRTLILDVNDGNVLTPSVGPSWTRVSNTGSHPSSPFRFFDVVFPVGDYEIWGLQVEQGGFATSPIITTGSVGTRGSDVATIAGSFLNPFSLVVECEQFPSGTGNSSNQKWAVGVALNANDGFGFYGVGDNLLAGGVSNLGDASVTVPSILPSYRMAMSAIPGTSLNMSVNGSAVATGTNTRTDANSIVIGARSTALLRAANTYIRRIRVLPRTMSNTELQTVTSFDFPAFMAYQPDGFWFDFSNPNRMFQGTDESTTVSQNSVIGSVLDRRVGPFSPRIATQSVQTSKPIYLINGAKFDGTDDNLLTNYTPTTGENFLIARITVPSTVNLEVIAGCRTGTDTRFMVGLNALGFVFGGVGNHSVATIISDTARLNQTITVGITNNGSQVRLFDTDKIGYQGAQSGVVATTTPMMIGCLNTNGVVEFPSRVTVHAVVAGREFLTLDRFNEIASRL